MQYLLNIKNTLFLKTKTLRITRHLTLRVGFSGWQTSRERKLENLGRYLADDHWGVNWPLVILHYVTYRTLCDRSWCGKALTVTCQAWNSKPWHIHWHEVPKHVFLITMPVTYHNKLYPIITFYWLLECVPFMAITKLYCGNHQLFSSIE